MRRLATFVGVVAAAVAVSASSASALRPPEQTLAPVLTRYHSSFLSFSYPASWGRVDSCGWAASNFALLTLLTTVEPAPTCTPPTGLPGIQTFSPIVPPLASYQLDVEWWVFGPNVAGRSYKAPGLPIRIAGRAAHVAYLSPNAMDGFGSGGCALLGARLTVEATISLGQDNYLIADACLAGPDFASDEYDVLSMLATVRLPSS